MAGALSLDLRRRVVAAIDGGLSSREAARRFSIGLSTAGDWHRLWLSTGDVQPGRQGKPEGSKLDPHEAFILGLIEESRDITLAEIAEKLAEARGISACLSTVWCFLDKRDITYKKSPRTRPSRSARM